MALNNKVYFYNQDGELLFQKENMMISKVKKHIEENPKHVAQVKDFNRGALYSIYSTNGKIKMPSRNWLSKKVID